MSEGSGGKTERESTNSRSKIQTNNISAAGLCVWHSVSSVSSTRQAGRKRVVVQPLLTSQRRTLFYTLVQS